MTSGEVQTAPPSSGQQATTEDDSLMLAEAAIAGLEEIAAGLVVEEGALDDVLWLKNLGKSTG